MKTKEELHWEKTKKLGELRNLTIVGMIFTGLATYLFLLFYGLSKIDPAVNLFVEIFGS